MLRSRGLVNPIRPVQRVAEGVSLSAGATPDEQAGFAAAGEGAPEGVLARGGTGLAVEHLTEMHLATADRIHHHSGCLVGKDRRKNVC